MNIILISINCLWTAGMYVKQRNNKATTLNLMKLIAATVEPKLERQSLKFQNKRRQRKISNCKVVENQLICKKDYLLLTNKINKIHAMFMNSLCKKDGLYARLHSQI